MSIKNITDKILSDAKARESAILSQSQQEANKIVEDRINEAKALEKQIISKAEEEASAKRNRVIQGAELRVRNEKLAAKHEVIEKTFSIALDSLERFSASQFINFVESTLKDYNIKDNAVLRVNEFRYVLLTPEVLKGINSSLGANFTLGKILENGKDGFIIEQGGTSINCTFEALVNSLKEDLIFDVSKILFE